MKTFLISLGIVIITAGVIVAGLFVAGKYFADDTPAPPPEPVREQTPAEVQPTPAAVQAKEVKAPKYKITMSAGDMEISPSAIKVRYGKKIKKLPVPEKYGYEFDGWYTDRLGGTKIENGDRMKFTRDIDVFARWVKTSFGEDRNVRGLPVLMYHQFYDPEQGEEQKAGLKANYMLASDFDDQMHLLSEAGCYFPDWDEVYAYVLGEIDLPENSIVITIDDGAKSFYKYAVPTLEKYKVRGTGFIIAKNLTYEMVGEYASEYVSLQSHTFDMHKGGSDGRGLFTTIDEEGALEDLNKAIDILGTKDALAYPYGHHNERTEAALEAAGIRMGFTTSYGKVRPGMNPYALPRVRMSSGMSLSSFASQLELEIIDTAVTGAAVSDAAVSEF
jgi:uncharacterized repeat protein (TIGR02543 family)